MPGIDGFETCRRLKQNKALTHVPVIFMTGLSDTEHIVQGLEAGGVDYVTKPIVPGELLARIRVHLANARIAHSARTALDAFGRYLLAASHTGRIFWCTPQAGKLLGKAFRDFDTRPDTFSRATCRNGFSNARQGQASSSPTDRSRGRCLLAQASASRMSARSGPTKICFGWSRAISATTRRCSSRSCWMTEREAEVLLWIARGKSNRDIAEILSLSPRTVNKHLEQIYAKLGVENRTSAAALAVRTLGVR